MSFLNNILVIFFKIFLDFFLSMHMLCNVFVKNTNIYKNNIEFEIIS